MSSGHTAYEIGGTGIQQGMAQWNQEPGLQVVGRDNMARGHQVARRGVAFGVVLTLFC